ncbi:hypothetical protein DFH09DRAFT_1270433 [Mycena vulgaris]|nr:hypothetical protein DFH09DRAFT_1270433 [Mycena vulgaris]
MDQLANITAALNAGKFPSTAQVDAFIDWLTKSAIPAVEPSADSLSGQGRVLAKDIRQVLEAYKALNSNKNKDDVLQEAVWHLAQGDVNTPIDSPDAVVNKKEVSSDLDAVRSSLRTIQSIVWQSLSSEGSFLLNDFASFARLALADAAEVVQDQAGRAKDGLRDVEEGVQDGKRDNLGRDKKRVDEEKDVRVAFEHGMDTLKDAGSGVIGAGQAAKERRRKSRIAPLRASRACERAQKDPAYHKALSTLFDTLHKWVNKAFDTASDKSFSLDTFVEDSTPEQHVSKALNALKTLLDRFAKPESSVDAVLRQGAALLFCHTDAGRTWEELKATVKTFVTALVADEDVERLRAAHAKLGEDAERGLVEAGQEAETGVQALLERAAWFWRDLFAVYAPRALAMLKDIPIPRTEYSDQDLDLVLENLDISSFGLNPCPHLRPQHHRRRLCARRRPLRRPRASGRSRTSGCRRCSSLSRKSHSTITTRPLPCRPANTTGILSLKMPPQGIDVDINIRLISSEDERLAKRKYHQIERVTVEIADNVELNVRESNHAVMLALFKPIFNMRFREALGRALSEQLRAAIDWADGIAWDVGRRAEVFADAGAGRGAALAGAVWSEMGRLSRESNTGWRATGTGVVIEDSVEGGTKFAMGAEPQVLSGDKRGPMGTGRFQGQTGTPEDATKAAKEGAKDVKQHVQGLVGEGKKQVRSFQRTVDEKAGGGEEERWVEEPGV